MRLFKRDGVYYIEFGRGRKKSLKTGNRALATRIFEAALKETLLGRVVKLGVKRVSLDAFRSQYIKSREGEKAKGTIEIDEKSFKKLADFLPPGIYLPDIEPSQAEGFIAHLRGKGLKPTTINIALRTLKAAFNRAVELELIERSPFQRIKAIKIKDALPRALTFKEVERVLMAAQGSPNHFKDYALTCLYTAGRRESVAKLCWEDFREYDGQWTVTFRKTKTGVLTIPLADNLKQTLFARKQAGGPVFPYFHHSPGEASKAFRRVADAAGLDSVKLHDLRHTAATFMILKGVPTRIVQQVLGHSTIAMTEVYTRVAAEHLRSGINSLEF